MTDKLPIIAVPPCDELEMVIEFLWERHTFGELAEMVNPSMWRDLDTLKGLCPTLRPDLQEALTVIETYREVKS